MKKLSELYSGYSDILINDIKINSKEVEKNDLFVCIKGANLDRHYFIHFPKIINFLHLTNTVIHLISLQFYRHFIIKEIRLFYKKVSWKHQKKQ